MTMEEIISRVVLTLIAGCAFVFAVLFSEEPND